MYQHPGNRPVFINLFKLHFPFNAWLSVLHRITGLILFITLLGYLALINLMLVNDHLTLSSVQTHWITLTLHSAFWLAVWFHWLTGMRHLIAEQFTQAPLYNYINSLKVSQVLLASWVSLSALSLYTVWFA